MADAAVLESVRRYIHELEQEKIPVALAVLFGSQLNGSAKDTSDVDLVVISPVFDTPGQWPTVRRLWHCAAKVDPRIEPIPCGEAQWREGSDNMIVEIARQQGQIITPN